MILVAAFTRTPLLEHNRAVRQFIGGNTAARIMDFKMPRHVTNAGDDTLLELAVTECNFHFPADLIPALQTDTRMDATVGDDFDVPVGEQQVNENPVVVCGVPDP